MNFNSGIVDKYFPLHYIQILFYFLLSYLITFKILSEKFHLVPVTTCNEVYQYSKSYI